MSAAGMIYVCWMNFRPGCDVSQMCDLYNSPYPLPPAGQAPFRKGKGGYIDEEKESMI